MPDSIWTTKLWNASKQYAISTIDGLSPYDSWYKKGNHLLQKGLEDYAGGLFQIVTGTGPKIVLPNQYVDELRNHNRLSFTKAFAPDFFHNIPGFDGHFDYSFMIGKLNFVKKSSCPDIAYPVHQCACFMVAPKQEHRRAPIWIRTFRIYESAVGRLSHLDP